MSVIRFKVDGNISSYLSTSQIFPYFDEKEIILIETQFLKILLNLCTARVDKRVVIRGPSGTGKTSSAIYLFNNLNSVGPLLLCSPQFYQSDDVFIRDYKEAFCKGNNYQ